VNPTDEDVDGRVRDHVGLVHHVVGQMMRWLSTEAERDELISMGTIGLMQAARSFDEQRGLRFSTYATPRIRGAVLDGLRGMDPLPRSLRRKVKAIASVREELGARAEHATDAEVAQRLGLTLDEYWEWIHDAEFSRPVSLTKASSETRRRGITPAHQVDVPDARRSVEEDIGLRQEIELMLRVVAHLLTDQEREILRLYYWEDITLSEIAMRFGLTESRISQVRSKALRRLRERMER
jgi:RNA polymerase sigma factor FliA